MEPSEAAQQGPAEHTAFAEDARKVLKKDFELDPYSSWIGIHHHY